MPGVEGAALASAGRGRMSCSAVPRSCSSRLSCVRVWATPLISGDQVSLTRQIRMRSSQEALGEACLESMTYRRQHDDETVTLTPCGLVLPLQWPPPWSARTLGENWRSCRLPLSGGFHEALSRLPPCCYHSARLR